MHVAELVACLFRKWLTLGANIKRIANQPKNGTLFVGQDVSPSLGVSTLASSEREQVSREQMQVPMAPRLVVALSFRHALLPATLCRVRFRKSSVGPKIEGNLQEIILVVHFLICKQETHKWHHVCASREFSLFCEMKGHLRGKQIHFEFIVIQSRDDVDVVCNGTKSRSCCNGGHQRSP